MEEILSSIRRIIADEEDGGKSDADDGAPAVETGSEALDQDADDFAEDEDVLELTRMVRESGEVVEIKAQNAAAGEPDRDAAAGEDEHVELAYEDVDLAPVEDAPERPASQDTSQEDRSAVARQQAAAEQLVSDVASSAATGAFAKLSSAFQRTPADEAVADDSGRTVEQFVEDIIRPALRDWMDENLPRIVERLVHKEIQKIARRAELSD